MCCHFFQSVSDFSRKSYKRCGTNSLNLKALFSNAYFHERLFSKTLIFTNAYFCYILNLNPRFFPLAFPFQPHRPSKNARIALVGLFTRKEKNIKRIISRKPTKNPFEYQNENMQKTQNGLY